jgi:AcrR family transcriptional regulator
MSQEQRPAFRNYKPYADAREDTRELLRQNLVQAADHLLATEGPEALTVRRIAEELDASTKIIYSLFGGKEGLANELYLEGCERLRQKMAALPQSDNAGDYIRAGCWAYWAFAEANPSYYAVMFGNAIPNFKPDDKSLETVSTAFKILVEVLGTYQAQGKLPRRDLAETIRFIWAPLHGVISLYQGKHYSEAEGRRLYETVIDAVIHFLLSP